MDELKGEKAFRVFKKEIVPLLANIQSRADTDRLISKHKMSIILGIKENFIWEEIEKFKFNPTDNTHKNEATTNMKMEKENQTDYLFSKLVGVMKRTEKENADVHERIKEKLNEIFDEETLKQKIIECKEKITQAEIS